MDQSVACEPVGRHRRHEPAPTVRATRVGIDITTNESNALVPLRDEVANHGFHRRSI